MAVAALQRRPPARRGSLREVNRDLTLLQITAPISPGSSGGPLLDDEGAVVGVTTAMVVSGQNLNFAVPARSIAARTRAPSSQRRFPSTKPCICAGPSKGVAVSAS